MQASFEKKWIIKSENKILGPYSFEQIEDLIKKKQITLIDEVRDMNTRWSYIRETKDLMPIVENIRTELAASEDPTKTIQTKTAQSETISKTMEVPTSEKTPAGEDRIEKTTAAVAATPSVQDVDFKETLSAVDNKIPPPVKQYVFENDPQIKNQVQKNNKVIFLSIIAVLISVIIGGLVFYNIKVNNQKKHEQNLLAQIRKFNHYGLESQTIDLFGTLTPELQKQVIPDLISIIPKLDAAGFVNGQTLIAELKAHGQLNDSKKALIDIIDFQQALNSQDLKKANECLIRAKDLDPTSDIIKENEAILNFLEGKYDKASVRFWELYQKLQKGRFLFGHALSQSLNPELTLDELAKSLTEIERFLVVRVDYKKELLLVSMLLNKKANKDNDFMSNYRNFIDTPIGLRKYFQIPFAAYAPFYSISAAKDLLEKLKMYLTLDQKFMVETHYKLENGEVSAAQALINQYQNLIQDKDTKVNLQIQIDFSLKNYDALLAFEKTLSPDVTLNTASHLSLLLAKKSKAKPVDEMINHVQFLKASKNILSFWAELLTLDQKPAQVSFVQMNSVLNDDFIPYQEIKGLAE